MKQEMRILWFNWRDILNPEAGGAEVFTHEIMKRLANRGHEMTLLTSRFKDCQLNENIDRLDVIREGNKYSCNTRNEANSIRTYRQEHDN
jgi:hypothetical protein